jgi:hypothetical protein
MISVIIYGRNDDCGYGMTKRVAISLNAIAHQIDGGTAELLFVDYNTPDHLPTLPELIWDTLTKQARDRLRVLRVRPSAHARFASDTLLPVIESVARNVALRRTNPANCWILSTNTDAVIVPRGSATLLQVVQNLPRGFYGLPRFELPERAWESFVRNDPVSTIALARDWGNEARLREATIGVADVGFDNPGDFQLMRRQDLVVIGGFEEEMRNRAHVDHNIAKRLAKVVGPVRDLSDQLELYHLGHSRSTSSPSGIKVVENDITIFVDAIRSPMAFHSEDSWGLPDVQIDEIRLDVAPGEIVRATCRELMQPLQGKPLETHYTPESFDDLRYDAGHISAYLLDLLSTYSRRTIFAFAGTDSELLRLLSEGLALMGFNRRILVPASCAELVNAAGKSELQVGNDNAAIGAADVLLFAFGLATQSPGDRTRASGDDMAVNEVVANLFEQACRQEQAALDSGKLARMFVTVGMVHTRFEQRFWGRLAGNVSPYTMRLRFGFLAQPRDSSSKGGAQQKPQVLLARKWIRPLLKGDRLSLELQCRLAADAAALRVHLAAMAEDASTLNDSALALARLDELLRPDPRLAGRIFAVPPPTPALSGLARGDAWDDVRFAIEARRFSQVRSGWTWQRARLLTGIARLESSLPDGRVLAVVEHEEMRLLEVLASDWAPVDVVHIHHVAEPQPSTSFSVTNIPRRASVIGFDQLLARQYRLIVAPHESLFCDGISGLGRKLHFLQRALAPNGVLAIASETSLLGPESHMRPTLAVSNQNGFPATCARLFGLELCDGETWGMRSDDLARIGSYRDHESGSWILGLWRGGDLLWPAVWFFRKTGEAREVSLADIDRAFVDLLLGEQIDKLRLGNDARRESGLVRAGNEAGHVVFGPFLRLSAGGYVTKVELSDIKPRAGASKPKIVVEAALGQDIVVQEVIDFASPGGKISTEMNFKVNEGAGPWELRIWADGSIDFAIESCSLERDDVPIASPEKPLGSILRWLKTSPINWTNRADNVKGATS